MGVKHQLPKLGELLFDNSVTQCLRLLSCTYNSQEPFLGISRQNIRRKMKCWMEKQHLVLWRGPCSTQRQAQELSSGLDLATRA